MKPLPLVEGCTLTPAGARAQADRVLDFDFDPSGQTLRVASGEPGREGNLTALARFFEEEAT